jgi:hypothetical protein
MANEKNYGYEITARAATIGGGWRLRLLQSGEEVGGGAFPSGSYLDDAEAYEDALAVASAWLDSRECHGDHCES